MRTPKNIEMTDLCDKIIAKNGECRTKIGWLGDNI